jgi:hypothetical protein
MAKGRKGTSATRGRKSVSLARLGSAANFNRCKAALELHKALLADKLKAHSGELPLPSLLKYQKALGALTVACVAVKGIECVGPNMSFDLARLNASTRRAKTTRRRAR